jgi:hypothetical protein
MIDVGFPPTEVSKERFQPMTNEVPDDTDRHRCGPGCRHLHHHPAVEVVYLLALWRAAP